MMNRNARRRTKKEPRFMHNIISRKGLGGSRDKDAANENWVGKKERGLSKKTNKGGEHSRGRKPDHFYFTGPRNTLQE